VSELESHFWHRLELPETFLPLDNLLVDQPFPARMWHSGIGSHNKTFIVSENAWSGQSHR
jgi:hypothetical protein